jgi:hypothetical protein
MKRVLDTDPVTGITHLFYADSGECRVVVEQDVSTIIEDCRRRFNDAPARFGEWTHVGVIPMATYREWQNDGRDVDQTFLRRWLNDGDVSKFRTHPGTI